MSTLKVYDFVRSAQPTPIEWSSALDELVHTIASYVKQCPPDFQTPAHHVITLQNAVIHHDWANDPLRRMSESKYDLPTFHQALGKELQFLSTKQSVSRIAQKTYITPQPWSTMHSRPLQQPSYGRFVNRGKYPIPSHFRGARRQSSGSFATRRPHIDPAAGKNRIDPITNKPRRCKACGSDNHHAYERDRCNPSKIVANIQTRFANTDNSVEILADLLEAYIENATAVNFTVDENENELDAEA
jgi:hypothetical protein